MYNEKRTWAEIDLESIAHNYRQIRRSLPEGCRFLGVVKADAYGHGAVEVSRLLQDLGADYLAVSCLDEALELRREGVETPILILGHTPSEYTHILIAENITQTVTCEAKALEYSAEAAKLGRILKIHIKLDTGMSRLGFLCAGDYFNEGVKNIISACKLPNLEAEGIYTHFAVSDTTDEADREYTLGQFALFKKTIAAVKERSGITFTICHCANSGAVVNYPEMALDMVRPGLLLYGCGDTSGRLGLRPCMRLMTRVSTIKHYEEGTSVSYGGIFKTERHTRMGVLAIGYADGLMRCLSDKFSVMTSCGEAKQCGRICMDMCMADLTGLDKVQVGDAVEIFGRPGSIERLSEIAGTIPYELMCAVSKRVPRVYK